MREERAKGGRELERRDRKKGRKRDEGEETGQERRRKGRRRELEGEGEENRKGKEKITGRKRKGRKRWWQVWIMGWTIRGKRVRGEKGGDGKVGEDGGHNRVGDKREDKGEEKWMGG